MQESRALLPEPAEEHGPMASGTFAVYGSIINEIPTHLAASQYLFVDDEYFRHQALSGRLPVKEINRICAAEILYRAHMASATSIYRACYWYRGALQARVDENLFAWAAAVRGLIEACGDTIHSLINIPANLADRRQVFYRCLKGRESRPIGFAEFEHPLVHFTHGHKGGKKIDLVQPYLEAEKSFVYLERVVGIDRSAKFNDLYKTLCEIVHPSAPSIQCMLHLTPLRTVVVQESGSREYLRIIEEKHSACFSVLPAAAFNISLLTLRVLQEFDLFPRSKTIRGIRFDNRISQSIEESLRKSY